MLTRKTPLRRGGPIKRKTRVRRVNPERAAELREYHIRKVAYIAAHPFDQIAIAMGGYREERVKAYGMGFGQNVPLATQIHHRNKGYGVRLNDERWWMAASSASHKLVEDHKNWARENGLLLPIQADAEGRWGSGNQAMPTPELLASLVGKGIAL